MVGSFIIGHTNTSPPTFILQTFSATFDFILLPGDLSISNSNFKTAIADSDWYENLIEKISPMAKDGNDDDYDDKYE